jgi:hypothetical protein
MQMTSRGNEQSNNVLQRTRKARRGEAENKSLTRRASNKVGDEEERGNLLIASRHLLPPLRMDGSG